MADVTLTIGGRGHTVACRDGEEAQLRALGERLDSLAPTAARAAGNGGPERQMLFIALMLADALAEAERTSVVAPVASAHDDTRLDALAARLERLADSLEQAAPSA